VADDFKVEEILGFEPDGAGGHVLLEVEKRDANTGWVAAQLARHAGIGVRDIGFSGHKDRHAVTQQAFSLPLRPGIEPGVCLDWQGYRVSRRSPPASRAQVTTRLAPRESLRDPRA
jgi:tRNA pseudouridine13 synthase